MAIDYKKLAAKAAQTEDQTETKAGFEASLPPAGPGVARFVGYIECGDQARKAFAGKEKKPAPFVLLMFDLLSPKNIREHEGKTYCDRITIRMNKLLDGKAKFKRLFNTMVRGRESIKHMAQMLNEPFVVNVIHSKSRDGTKTYANLNDENGAWFVNAPVVTDALAGTQQDISASIPPAISPVKIFLWDDPSQETWDSLFIDGTYEKKNADGTVEQVSKNWIQSMIVGATNFQGSALEAMLGGMPDLPVAEEQTEEEAAEEGAPAEEAAPEQPEASATNDDEEAALLKQLEAAKAKKAAAAAKKAEKDAQAPKSAPPKAADKAPATKAAPKAAPAQEPKKAPAAKAAPKAAEKPAQPSAADALKALGLG